MIANTPTLLLIITALLWCGPACNRDPGPIPPGPPTPGEHRDPVGETPNTVSGETVYDRRCAPCHGDDGSGTSAGLNLGAPNLADHTTMLEIGESGVRNAIILGSGQAMPPTSGLTEAEIEACVSFVMSLSRPEAP